MSSFYEIKRICSENPVEFLLDQRIVLLIENGFENLSNEVNHGFEKILILENHFALSMTEQYSHVYVTDFLAFLLQMVGLEPHLF